MDDFGFVVLPEVFELFFVLIGMIRALAFLQPVLAPLAHFHISIQRRPGAVHLVISFHEFKDTGFGIPELNSV